MTETKAAVGGAQVTGPEAWPRFAVRINLDALTDDQVREVGRRIMFEGWACKSGTVGRTFFADLGYECTGELLRRERIRREGGEGAAILPFGEFEIRLPDPDGEARQGIVEGLRRCMRGCNAGAELVEAVVRALEAGPR
jgi:hypothetical protein